MFRDFAESAKALTKNPLGVIGLFIVLVYGFACLVLGVGGSHLEPGERIPIICFIVLFPFVILGAFYRLVTKHHKKLYAPSDFRDERNFFEPLSEDRKGRRMDEEVHQLQLFETAVEKQSDRETQTPPRSLPTIRSSYAEAERLGFRAIEDELGKPVQKYVRVNAHGRTEEFDGLLLTQTTANVIEIKYFSRPAFKREFLEAVLHRGSAFLWDQLFEDFKTREDVTLWMVIVVDFPREAMPEFEKKVQDLVRSKFFPVNFRFYHMDDLKRKYGQQDKD